MLPNNIEELRQRWIAGERFHFFLFYGHKPPKLGTDASCLSQWFSFGFEVDGVHYRTAEHWMMAEKARLFQDAEMLEAIVDSETPREAKALGRKVRHFDPEVWNENKFDIVMRGNVAKFSQHFELRNYLLGTRTEKTSLLLAAEASEDYCVEAESQTVRESRAPYGVLNQASSIRKNSSDGSILVEAAGRDRIWGIGLGPKNPKALDPMQWRGQNLLGFALTKVREQLSAE